MNYTSVWDKYFTVRNFAILTAAFTIVLWSYIVIADDATKLAAEVPDTPKPESPYGEYMKYINVLLLALIGYLLREGIIALKGLVSYVFKLFQTVEANQIRLKNLDDTVDDIRKHIASQNTRLTKLENAQKN